MSDAVHIPEPSFIGLKGESEGMPEIWLVNRGLVQLEPKAAFPWHLSIIVECKETYEVGLPTTAEGEVLKEVGETFDANLMRDRNAVQLARVTWNHTRQYVYRVRDPEVANAYLQSVIAAESHLRPFEYEMSNDPTWVHAEAYLSVDGSA